MKGFIQKSDYERRMFTELNFKLEKDCKVLRDNYENIRKKFSEKILKSVSPVILDKSFEGNVKKNLEIYEKEFKSLKKIVKKRDIPNILINTQASNKILQQKLDFLIKENERLNKNKFSCHSSENLNTCIGDLEAEIEKFEFLIEKSEEKFEYNQNSIKNTETRLSQLKSEYENLITQIEPIKIISKEKSEILALLLKKHKILKTSFKNSVWKHTEKIKDLEKNLENMRKESFTLQTKLFKKNQQKRLIEMSESEMNLNKKRSKTKKKYEFNTPDVSFMYKPSINRLYS